MEIFTFPLGHLETNCYLVVNGSEALAVDPGGEPSQLVAFLKQKGLRLVAILNTHLHFDHIAGNAALAKATGAPIYLNEDDLFLLEALPGSRYGLPETEKFEYQPLEAGEITFAGLRFTAIHTPGPNNENSLRWDPRKS